MTDKKKSLSTMAQRFLIGIPVGGAVVCVLAFGDLSLLFLIILFAWIALREFWELTGIAQRESILPLSWLGEICTTLLLISVWLYPDSSIFLQLVLLLPLIFIWQLVARVRGEKGFVKEVAVVILGIVYIGVFLSFVFKLRQLQLDLEMDEVLQFSDGFFKAGDLIHFTIFPVFISWGSDTSALLTGKYFGKSKLAPELSPGKTKFGLMGAMVGSAVVVTVYAWLIGLIGQVQLHEIVIFGLVGGAVAQIGDLVESAIKRQVGAKDSSHVFGPHGGMLDKLDAFLFLLPVTYLFFFLVLG